MSAHKLAPSGKLDLRIIRAASPEIIVKDKWAHPTLADVLRYDPKSRLGASIKAILKYLPDSEDARAAAMELIDRVCSAVVIESALYGKVTRGKFWQTEIGRYLLDPTEDLGLLGTKVVTTAGVGFIVDAFQNLVEAENMKYHALGTGSGAESAADTALGTELTTEYTGNVRATGTTTEGASANIYRTVGSNLLDGTPGAALREHGVFSANAAGVLLDRTVYAAVTLVSGDTFASTYELTLTAGS